MGFSHQPNTTTPECHEIALWIGNIIAALPFSAGHLPGAMFILCLASPIQMPTLMLAEMFILNSAVGLVAGERYIRDGLIAAIGVQKMPRSELRGSSLLGKYCVACDLALGWIMSIIVSAAIYRKHRLTCYHTYKVLSPEQIAGYIHFAVGIIISALSCIRRRRRMRQYRYRDNCL
jgi:hypothetical protein